MQLYLLPYIHGLFPRFELTLQAPRAFQNPNIVKLDPLALCFLLTMPVGGFKTLLGARRLGSKELVMPVKTIHHGLGDFVGQRRVKSGGKHRQS